jgi:ribonuclease VapC
LTVLDTSAVIALLMREPGADRVAGELDDATAPTTVLAEIVGYFARHDVDLGEVRASLAMLELPFLAFDDDLAWRTGALEPRTRAAGLSLTDRSCLALAARLRAKAVTGDRAWAGVAEDTGVTVELIR